MGILVKLLGWLTPNLIGAIAGPFLELAKAHFQKKISLEELHVKMGEVLMTGLAKVESDNASALAQTFSTFMQTSEKVLIMRVGWAAALFSQLFVLVWHQFAIPFMVFMQWTCRTAPGGEMTCAYPSSGSTVEWSYALVAALCGLAPAVFRGGAPSVGGGWLASLKALVGR